MQGNRGQSNITSSFGRGRAVVAEPNVKDVAEASVIVDLDMETKR